MFVTLLSMSLREIEISTHRRAIVPQAAYAAYPVTSAASTMTTSGWFDRGRADGSARRPARSEGGLARRAAGAGAFGGVTGGGVDAQTLDPVAARPPSVGDEGRRDTVVSGAVVPIPTATGAPTEA
jgi:hypothetical protein